jgi:hypothetical protein
MQWGENKKLQKQRFSQTPEASLKPTMFKD